MRAARGVQAAWWRFVGLETRQDRNLMRIALACGVLFGWTWVAGG